MTKRPDDLSDLIADSALSIALAVLGFVLIVYALWWWV